MDKKALRKLTAEWYKKLADSGFEDIETIDGNFKNPDSQRSLREDASGQLVPTVSHYNKFHLQHSSLIQKQSRAEYYRLASQFVHTRPFKANTKSHQDIWLLHCEGLSLAKVAKRLNITIGAARFGVDTIKKQVFGVIAHPSKGRSK